MAKVKPKKKVPAPKVVIPTKPVRTPVPNDWEHKALHEAVKVALKALPTYFKTDTHIVGIKATDIHTFASALGAAIEEQVVATLNAMRDVWDPENEYGEYYFYRQPQTFPDVLLRKDPLSDTKDDIILGIELKGWYLLAKEGEGNFRFKASSTACSPQDLIVVVPWVLRHVTSGDPVVFTPFIESAVYSAEYRNYYWQYLRGTDLDKGIDLAVAEPYPVKSDTIDDRPADDDGGNFGRIFRYGVMDEYLVLIEQARICGIEARYWRLFFKEVESKKSQAVKEKAIQRIASQVDADPEEIEDLVDRIMVAVGLLKND